MPTVWPPGRRGKRSRTQRKANRRLARQGGIDHRSMSKKEMNMQDKPVALVTGANQGMGLQIAKDLVAHGFAVLVGSRNLERGEAAAKEVGPDACAIQLDVTDENSIVAAAKRIRSELGRLDVLVNNAAISHTRRLPGMSVEEFAKHTCQ